MIFFMKQKDRVLLQQIGSKMREIRPTVFIDYVLHETSDDGDKNSKNYLFSWLAWICSFSRIRSKLTF